MVCWGMGMAPAGCYSVMLFLLYLVTAHSKCEDSFNCGSIGSLEFPFSPSLKPECGLFSVNCTCSPPVLHLGGGGEEVFLEVHKKLTNNRFRVKYRTLAQNANETLCSFFWSFPHASNKTPSVLFSIHPNKTVVSCPKTLSSEIRDEHLQDFKKLNSCDFFDYFYRDSAQDVQLNTTECYVLHVPVESNPVRGMDLFHGFSWEFELEWHVSTACGSCHQNGGMCITDTDKKFWCKERKQKNTSTKLVLAISASAAFVGLCLVAACLIYRCKKKTNGTYHLSKNIASGPSSKSDLELGGGLYFGIPIFSYQELEEATHNFDLSNELGDGGFGTVYYGKLHDGREVAIKRLYEHNCRRVEQFLNEIKILTGLRHPNLVSLYGCTSRRSRELLLVYEYIPNGTVADHLHGEVAHTSPLTWPIRMRIAIETANALAYLHNSDIIHRDVKTNNILLDKNFCVKVADFGISRLFPNDVSHISTAPQGTPGYVDPEYHQCYQLTDRSDVYSFGVVLIELISSMPAVDLTRHRHEINLANLALDRIQRCAFEELIDSSLRYQSDHEVARMVTSVAELAFRCLQLEKDLRPSMDEVLTYLKDIQAGEDWSLKNTEGGDGKYSAPEKIIISPETDVVSLKGNIQSSPVAVTESWTSISSATTNSIT